MTALKWTNYFDAFADPYVTADVTQQYYKTNFHHRAQWADPALKNLFIPSSKTANSTNSTAAPTHTSSPIQTTPPAPSSNHAGAIAGGAVGAVAFLALLALLAWYIHHQKVKKSTAAAQAHAEAARKAHLPSTAFEKSELPSLPPKDGGPGAEMPAGGAYPLPGGLQDGSRQEFPGETEGGHGNEHGGRVGLHEM
jgi:hypothetical protein